MGGVFRSLRDPALRLWLAGSLVSSTGTWIQRTAQDWLVLTELSSDSGLALGITSALQFGPALLVTPVAGLVADRFDRRYLLMATQAVTGLISLTVGLLVLSGRAELWHVYVAAGALGLVWAFETPVRQTFTGALVPPERLSNAVGLSSSVFNIGRLLGPALAGLMIAGMGSGWAFVVNAASMVGTLGALAMMRPEHLHPIPSEPRHKGQFREGLAYVRSRRDLMLVMVVVGVTAAFAMNIQVTQAMMARTVFDSTSGGFGLVGSLLAVGTLSGALMSARRERPRLRGVICAALGLGAATVVQAVAPTFVAFAVVGMAVGFAMVTVLNTANATIQLSTDPRMRGRVMALYMVIIMGPAPVAAPVVGWLGEQWGARWALAAGGLCAMAGVGIATVVAMRGDSLAVAVRLRPRPTVRVVSRVAEPDEQIRSSRDL